MDGGLFARELPGRFKVHGHAMFGELLALGDKYYGVRSRPQEDSRLADVHELLGEACHRIFQCLDTRHHVFRQEQEEGTVALDGYIQGADDGRVVPARWSARHPTR